MFFKKWLQNNKHKQQPATPQSMDDLLTLLKRSSDFRQFSLTNEKGYLIISYYRTLVDHQKLQERVLKVFRELALQQSDIHRIDDITNIIPIEDIVITEDTEMIESKLLQGYGMLQLKASDRRCAMIQLFHENTGLRDQNEAENEFSVVGPKIGFVENIEINIHLLRQHINSSQLIIKEMNIGSMSHTKVIIIYIEGVTNEHHVQTMTERLQNIDYDVVFDSSQLHQIISDNSLTPFPLALTTERVDRAVWSLITGQVAVLSNGSPYAITAPATLLDFFISPEDYYLPWLLASFFRVIRIFGALFSIFASSIYIAVLTYHYEMIPRVLLGPLNFSRHNVPFPPVLEVFFLEITIELLREAGARLPAKVGQTLGIVGGIVIGQAAVEAALTSNVLLIIVALSALASFTTPIFKMSNTIRFLRFPLIIFASIWGGLGIAIGISFLLVHLSRLESLGSPYTVPLYPFRPTDFKDSIIRSSLMVIAKRPAHLRTRSIWRYHPSREQENKNEFDE
ncbi:spore germination protein [Paenibacillus naphthalenovorans]|uniref:spore germination protein n=1 Tax=Paenibacillus naphthalenovorans TaxID=162209 RepID=UPI0010B9F5F5|nr:spore germination protein [Paenibacillus naphthalenovorans]GCL73345.1 spore germination protein [Paenibacillus naphthalenovorans]